MKSRAPADQTVTVNGLRLHYVDWGGDSGQTMLLLHGFMGCARVWDALAKRFRSRYRVIALDQRGHGESEWSEDLAYTLDDHFSDIAGFIEHLDPGPLIIVGHSMGGRNALFYSVCFPEKVDRLVLVDARPGNSAQASRALKNLVVNLPLEADTVEEAVGLILSVFPRIPREVCSRIVKYGYRGRSDGKLVPCYDKRMSVSMDRSGYAAEDLWRFLKNLACPTLVVRGKESEFLSRSDARKMCEIIPDAVWREAPDSAHAPFLENPGGFTRIFESFLSIGKALHSCDGSV